MGGRENRERPLVVTCVTWREAVQGGLQMARWSREQRFDMRVLTVLALIILVTSILMLTIASDIFWTAVG